MENFKRKETENLLFTSKLTEKNTKLQSENSILNEKVDENESLLYLNFLFALILSLKI